ncbi:MAG TPA: hypothetical protein VGR29_03785 [Thermomicrobiales bacterium]|nr:hypothetical protein [Thermomicrobiales bacterium]
MVIRCVRVLMLLALLFAGFFSLTIMVSASAAMPHNEYMALLQDDPLLPGDLTPDDDGDGVVDENDSAPNDPNEGTAPEPGDTDPIADGDNDGLPNALDPDDDSDGVSDDDENLGGDNAPSEPVTKPTSPSGPRSDPAPEPEPVFADAVPARTTDDHPVVLAFPRPGVVAPLTACWLSGCSPAPAFSFTAGGSLLIRRR